MMQLKTIQATAVRNVFEVMKDIINDVNVYFGKDGIRIISLDTARVSLVYMFMAAENFEEYSCQNDIIAGINMTNIYKLLKSVSNSDMLTMTIEGMEHLDIIIQNESKKSVSKFSLKLLDINEDILDVPEIDMNIITTLPSIDFQRICRDMGNLSNEIEIYRHDKNLILSCNGDYANQETTIECSQDSKNRVGNVFSLKYLNLFTKATAMSSSVQIFQHEDDSSMPIILKYSIANLGYMKFYLAPKVEN